MAKTYAIVMNKGGAGKTTVATNLAGVLAGEKGAKVLIADIDGQGNTAWTFGVDTSRGFENTIYDVFMGECTVKDIIINVAENLDVVPANRDMNLIEFDIYKPLEAKVKEDNENGYLVLKKALEQVQDDYDYIIIDTPPSLGFVTRNALLACDEVIIPFAPDHYTGKGLVSLLNEIDEFKLEQNVDIKIAGVVGMLIQQNTTVHKAVYETAKDYCRSRRIRLYNHSIKRATAYERATTFDNLPATLTTTRKKAGKAVKAFFELTDEIIEREVVANG
jgi:chromosome partitioning protein